MADPDFQAISSDEYKAGAVLNQSLFQRMVLNPEAMIRAADGAPRIKADALFDTVAAGIANRAIFAGPIIARTVSTSAVATAALADFLVCNAGTVRIKYQINAKYISGSTGWRKARAYVYRDGVQVHMFETTGNVENSFDLAIQPGQVLTFKAWGDQENSAGVAEATLSNIRIATNGPNLLPFYNPGWTYNIKND